MRSPTLAHAFGDSTMNLYNIHNTVYIHELAAIRLWNKDYEYDISIKLPEAKFSCDGRNVDYCVILIAIISILCL